MKKYFIIAQLVAITSNSFLNLNAQNVKICPAKINSGPPYNTGMLDEELAWRTHNGGHTDAPNMKYFIEWANKKINYIPVIQEVK